MKFFPSKAATVILLFFALDYVSAAERNLRKGTKGPKNGSKEGKASKAPKIAKASKAPKIAKKTLDFLTYNLYLGADLTPLLQDPENNDPCDVYEEATALDFPSRAQFIAKDIAKAKPIAIGLQEVIQLTGFGSCRSTGEDDNINFLDILLEALKDKGVEYDVVLETSDKTPVKDFVIGQAQLRDALIVRKGVITRNESKGLYITRVPTINPLFGDLTRNWVSAELEVESGKFVRVVSTHLEIDFFDSLAPPGFSFQANQATELVTMFPDGDDIPTVVLGDFNASPGVTSHKVMTDAGYIDTWTEVNDEDEDGYTCCRNPKLEDVEDSDFDYRIDYVFVSSGDFDVVKSKVFGKKFQKKIGKFNSDHAGVLSKLKLKG
ncbi:hypothetical protein CTEN210_12112 [Chaetoceros tenuissimus]|uniref:Endonuclease/exonuclease/phosphatase domain-containing protein n=1 Tax=Chaetoceros tenuissimus TaxID=426638 RepID=A0AAD3H9Y3_9STRA|nr:hypothetical protein CTEN210_12112 [Chaetoceros tenuissimus]